MTHFARRSEAYSFAVIFWQLVERKTPYEGHTPVSMKDEVFKAGGSRPKMTSSLWTSEPELKVTVERAWGGDIDERPSLAECAETIKFVYERLPESSPTSGCCSIT